MCVRVSPGAGPGLPPVQAKDKVQLETTQQAPTQCQCNVDSEWRLGAVQSCGPGPRTDNAGLQTRRRWHELLAPVQFMISRNWNIIKEGHKEETKQQT